MSPQRKAVTETAVLARNRQLCDRCEHHLHFELCSDRLCSYRSASENSDNFREANRSVEKDNQLAMKIAVCFVLILVLAMAADSSRTAESKTSECFSGLSGRQAKKCCFDCGMEFFCGIVDETTAQTVVWNDVKKSLDRHVVAVRW